MAKNKNNNKSDHGALRGAAREAQSQKVQQIKSTPQVGQRPGETVTYGAPGAAKPARNQSVGGSIRAAGANGNLSRNELLKISKESGKSASQIIARLDKVNSRLGDKKKAPIGLGSAAANAYTKGKLGPTSWQDAVNSVIPGAIKQGPIATGLSQMRATTTPMRQGQGGYSTPGMTVPKGQQVFGSFNGAPQLQIKPAWNANAGYVAPTTPTTTTTTAAGTTTGTGTGDGAADAAAGATTPLETLEPEMPSIQGGTNATLNGNATGMRSNKSSGKKSGAASKGTNQLKVNKSSVSGTGLNVRG